MGRLRRFIPISGPAAALWAWKNRHSLTAWGSFGKRALRQVISGDTSDLLTEARLRAALTLNEKTRGVSDLGIEVRSGEAILAGTVSADVRRTALAIARRTRGVRAIRDEMQERPSRGWFGRRQSGSSRISVEEDARRR